MKNACASVKSAVDKKCYNTRGPVAFRYFPSKRNQNEEMIDRRYTKWVRWEIQFDKKLLNADIDARIKAGSFKELWRRKSQTKIWRKLFKLKKKSVNDYPKVLKKYGWWQDSNPQLHFL